MLTARGVCLLFPALFGTAIGMLTDGAALTLLSLSVLLWLASEWLWFQSRLIFELPGIAVERTINGRAEDSCVCYAGRMLRIQVNITATAGRLRPWTRIRDVVPDQLAIASGTTETILLTSARQSSLSYDCRSRTAGICRLSGVRIRIQDPNGFFTSERFVECVQSLRILPTFDSAVSIPSRVKRLNGLPQHGIHRLQRAGMGSELLELREYTPGDPPKSIAWKVSARRDRLMTRQYESEVPIRTIVFVEDSRRTRKGSWGERQCDSFSATAANIIHTALKAGDPAGLVQFGETSWKQSTPGWGDRTLFRHLEALAMGCRLQPGRMPWSRELQAHAMLICLEYYPHLLDTSVNIIPRTFLPTLPGRWAINNTRSRLAGVICQLHGLTVAQWTRLIYDNDFMGEHLARLTVDAGRPFHGVSGSISSESPSVAATESTFAQLAQSLRQTIGRANDNEHYIVICDLLDNAASHKVLRPVIQLARGRHHRIGFVCPVPAPRGLSGNGNEPPTVGSLLHEAWHIEHHEQRRLLTRELRSWGADVAFADHDRQLSLILSELRLAHTGRALAGAGM